MVGVEELYISESMGHSQNGNITKGYQDMYPLEIRFRNNEKLLNINKVEEPTVDVDNMTPEEMKEFIRKMIGK